MKNILTLSYFFLTSYSFIMKKNIHTLNKLNLKKNKFINHYIPKSPNQIQYDNSLKNNNIDLVFCLGPAGTGKTLFACTHSIKELQNNKYNKIIITRPTITIEENIGFLPGDINRKMQPWTIPIFDIFYETYSKKEIDILIQNNIIEIAPLGFMQGRTFKNTFIIADEMQNSTPNQMFMLLTRIGENSKMVITGDPKQTIHSNNGLNDIIEKLNINYSSEENRNKDGMSVIQMDYNDIQRHPLVFKLTKFYSIFTPFLI
jgi:phosphate starvation-inducible protein PhoH and related proteins